MLPSTRAAHAPPRDSECLPISYGLGAVVACRPSTTTTSASPDSAAAGDTTHGGRGVPFPVGSSRMPGPGSPLALPPWLQRASHSRSHKTRRWSSRAPAAAALRAWMAGLRETEPLRLFALGGEERTRCPASIASLLAVGWGAPSFCESAMCAAPRPSRCARLPVLVRSLLAAARCCEPSWW